VCDDEHEKDCHRAPAETGGDVEIHVGTDAPARGSPPPGPPPGGTVMQYTSGSTGAPRGSNAR